MNSSALSSLGQFFYN